MEPFVIEILALAWILSFMSQVSQGVLGFYTKEVGVEDGDHMVPMLDRNWFETEVPVICSIYQRLRELSKT